MDVNIFGRTMLDKRIKRQVCAKVHSFFAAVSPGLEKLCADQLKARDMNSVRIQEGGVSFEGRLPDLYESCLCISTANRMLMRVCQFKASNFPALEKGASKTPWELYLPCDCEIEVKTSVRSSRLYHSEAVSQRIYKVVKDRLDKFGEPFKTGLASPQKIFVRAASDRFTLSLDASGDLLHMRGLTGGGGRAPLRETLASAILHFAEYDGTTPLVDPMCGSGSFSLEAALIATRTPPGWFRDFAFFSWPAFRETQWRHLRRTCEKQILHPQKPMIFASDLDSSACDNLKRQAKKHGLDGMISVSNRDFLSLEPPGDVDKPGLVVINPPYGLRLGSKDQALDLFNAMNRRLEAHFAGWRAALIIPEKSWISGVRFSKIQQRRTLSHGGLKMPLVVGVV